MRWRSCGRRRIANDFPCRAWLNRKFICRSFHTRGRGRAIRQPGFMPGIQVGRDGLRLSGGQQGRLPERQGTVLNRWR